jgi:hypothetical protein
MSVLNRIVRVATGLVRDAARSSQRRARRGQRAGHGGPERADVTVPFEQPLPALRYAPEADDDADPGEIVWAWVPYDENDGRGKDRPVLILARHAGGYLGLQATSQDHDRDRADEARWGRYWFDIGAGAWDSHGRQSEVRLDRVLYLPAAAVRRQGAALDEERFDAVAQALRAFRRDQDR